MFWTRTKTEGETKIVEMREGRAEIFIEAPPEAVWECLSDIQSYPEWAVWFKATLPEHLDRLDKAGDYFHYETTVLGVRFTGLMMSVERIRPTRSVFCLVSPYRGGGEYLLDPVAGGTRVRYTIWSEIPESYLGKLVDRILLANSALKKMNDHLIRLKSRVEGAAG